MADLLFNATKKVPLLLKSIIMRPIVVFVFTCFTYIALQAQPQTGLLAYYTFDNCSLDDNSPGGTGFPLQVNGNPTCDCGVKGDALYFDGVDDDATVFGAVNDIINYPSFSIAFYFKPVDNSGVQYLLSKQEVCTEVNAVSIQIQNGSRRINTLLSENPSKQFDLNTLAGRSTCWYHYVMVKQQNTLRVYINGQLVSTQNITAAPILNNIAQIVLGSGPCVATGGVGRFHGLMDEVHLYSRPLSETEVETFYSKDEKPDAILNFINRIYQGQTIDADVSNSCAIAYEWTPSTGVSDPYIAEPVLSPLDTTIYVLGMTDAFGCITYDTFPVYVIDPADFDCSGVMLPSAFTPNDDGLNDVFGISNYPTIDELKSFEVYNRWGNRIFVTTDRQGKWDATADGVKVNPGTYMYRVVYICNNKENVVMGEVTVIR
jgi:gliding motility-associated-like protein